MENTKYVITLTDLEGKAKRFRYNNKFAYNNKLNNIDPKNYIKVQLTYNYTR